MHTCEAAVVRCIDFRFEEYMRKWTDENLSGKQFDTIAMAGSTKDLKTMLKQIEISVKLHRIKKAILINHEECGAYGKDSTPERHTEDLRKARTEIETNFPEVVVELYYLHLNGEFEKVD
jgi:carbonic anhydrase